MMFEYKRLLSEAWYSNQLFWVMNLTLEILTVAILLDDYTRAPTMMGMACLNISGNLILVILMLKTERRTLQNRRP